MSVRLTVFLSHAPSSKICVLELWHYTPLIGNPVVEVEPTSQRGCMVWVTKASLSQKNLRRQHLQNQTGWLYCVECPQYSFRLEARAVSSFTVCHFLGMSPFWLSPFWFVAVLTYDVIRPRPLLDRQRYDMSCHSWTSVGRRREFGEVSSTERVNFRRSVIIAELWRPEVARR